MIRVILNGPMKRGDSLRDMDFNGMSLVESHTSWPGAYSGAGNLQLSAYLLLLAEV